MKAEPKLFCAAPESRFKWMAGSTAASAAAAMSSTALAETVQITQSGNSINATSGTLNADLTRDGVADIPGLNSSQMSGTSPVNATTSRYFNFVNAGSDGGELAFALFSNRFNATAAFNTEHYVSIADNFSAGPNPKSMQGLHPVVFTDARINGGAPSNGLVDILSASLAPNNNSITFVRFVFDDASPAAPTGITAGGTNKEWLNPAERAAVLGTISKLKRKAKKLKRKVRAAKKSGNASKAQRLKKKLKKLRKEERIQADRL